MSENRRSSPSDASWFEGLEVDGGHCLGDKFGVVLSTRQKSNSSTREKTLNSLVAGVNKLVSLAVFFLQQKFVYRSRERQPHQSALFQYNCGWYQASRYQDELPSR